MKRILAAAVGIALLGLLPLSAGAATLAEAGKSAVLMDVTTGTVLYEHNSHEALAPASVTKITRQLIEHGLIRESAPQASTGGRRAISLNTMRPAAWAIISICKTPGITGYPGKCPWKKGSFIVTFLMATKCLPPSVSRTRSTRRKGKR